MADSGLSPINVGSFRTQSRFPIAAVIQAMQQRPVLEEQIRRSQQQRQQAPFQLALQAAQIGSSLASDAAGRARLKAQQNARNEISQQLAERAEAQIQPFQQQLSSIPLEQTAIASPTPQPIPEVVQDVAGIEGQFRPDSRPLAGVGTPQPVSQDVETQRGDLEQAIAEVRQRQQLAQAQVQAGDLKQGLATFSGQPVEGEKRTFQKENILLPDGSVQLGSFDTKSGKFFLSSGEEAPSGSRKAFSEGSRFQFFTDANTGQRVKEDLITGERSVAKAPGGKPARSVADLTLKENDLLDKNIQRFTKDPIRSAAETSLSQLGNIKRVLNTDVGSATEPLKSLIIRNIAGEKGVLTDKDVARASGNQALVPRTKQLLKKWRDGKMTEQNKQELSKILSTIEKNSAKKKKFREDRFTNSISKRFNLDRDEVKEFLLFPTPTATLTEEGNKSSEGATDLGEGFSFRFK